MPQPIRIAILPEACKCPWWGVSMSAMTSGGGGGVGLLPCVQLQCMFVITGPVCPSLLGRYEYKEGHGMNKFHRGMQAQAQDPVARCLHVCLTF